MAITADQAAQLASTYQSGDTSGLQGLINQMGVTAGDVAQYFPGFDVGSLQGVTLIPPQPGNPDRFQGDPGEVRGYGPAVLSKKLFGGPPRDPGLTATYGPQKVSGTDISNFIQQNLSNPGAIAQAAQQYGISSGDIAAATGYKPEQQVSYFEKAGMLPTTSAFDYDLFPELRPGQERRLENLVNMLALGQELTPNQAAKLTKFGAKTGYDFFNVPTYKSLEEQLLERTGADFNAITSYIGQNIDDPTKIYQRAAELGITPEEVLLAYSATGKKGQSPYSFGQIKDYFETGKAGYNTAFDKLLSDTFGASSVEGAKKIFKPEDFANKSLESIAESLANSSENKAQDAFNFSSALYGYTDQEGNQVAGVLGYDPTQRLGTAKDLISGNVKDEGLVAIYKELLRTNKLTPELQNKLMQHLATTNPEAYVFQQNPDLLTFYTPIGDLVASPKDSGQYGYYKNIPILSASEVDRLLAGEVFRGGNNYFGYGGGSGRDDSMGWDLRSKYLGSITNGAGIFGVRANTDQIDYFSRVQAEIDRLGGLTTTTDNEGNTAQGIYVTKTDPETGSPYQAFIRAEELFNTEYDEYGLGNGAVNYKFYQDTMNALNNGATELKLDTSQFETPTELFNAVQDRTKNLYVVTGRANNWDAAESEALGLTGHGKSRGGVNHATVMYRKVGDKLVPVEDDNGNAIIKTFKFDDPETSKGFFGDLARDVLSVISIPPIALALSAATGGVSNLFSAATQPIVSTLVSAGVNELAANAVTNAVLSSLLTEATGGDASDAFLSTLISSGIGGTKGLPGLGEQFLNEIGFNNLGIADLVDPSTLGRVAGTYAGSAITGTDPTKILINQAITQGIRSLPGLSRIGSSFEDLQSGGEGFQLSDAERTRLDEEISSLGNDARIQGILGLPLMIEQDIIDVVNQIVPLLTAKGLNKQEATLLASNIISAARSA